MGIKDKVDVSTYADPSYSYETMKQIRLSFYSSNDLTDYLERGFVDDELEQIRLALEDELPIDLWLTDDMYAIFDPHSDLFHLKPVKLRIRIKGNIQPFFLSKKDFLVLFFYI